MALRLAQYRDSQLAITQDIDEVKLIGFYPREFYVLDNFSAFQVRWRSHKFATAEHAYQWSKFAETAPDVAKLIASAGSPHEAQRLAHLHKSRRRPNWSEVKVELMTDILRHKLAQHSYVRQKLLETLSLELVEDSPNDAFWGWGPNKDGRNELGRIWMGLRDELKPA